MACNCQNNNSTIQFTVGTTETVTFIFKQDISGYESGLMTIRKDYNTTPVISKKVSITEPNQLTITFSKDDTALFDNFEPNKTSAQYIFGLDLLNETENIQVNVLPQEGAAAPLCIVYKHIVIEEE